MDKVKVQSASLNVFCHPEELGEWLDGTCASGGLGWLMFRSGQDHGIQGSGSLVHYLRPDCRRLFLYPLDKAPQSKLTLTDVSSRPWGWVDVNPGAILKKSGAAVLTLTRIDAEEGYSEDSAKLCKYVRALRRIHRGTITLGVRGKYKRGPGETLYKNIGYTVKAAELHRAGTLWMKDGVNNVAFSPS